MKIISSGPQPNLEIIPLIKSTVYENFTATLAWQTYRGSRQKNLRRIEWYMCLWTQWNLPGWYSSGFRHPGCLPSWTTMAPSWYPSEGSPFSVWGLYCSYLEEFAQLVPNPSIVSSSFRYISLLNPSQLKILTRWPPLATVNGRLTSIVFMH